MTIAVVLALALFVLFLLALPFFESTLQEPVPSFGDPVEQDLREERDALMRAIRELEARQDLRDERRRELRARYEAKTAQVLQRLDQHRRDIPQERARPRSHRPVSVTAGLLLLTMVPSVALIGKYVLPRVNAGGTVTTNRQNEIALGRELQRLQRAARQEPSVANLLGLGDAYWQLLNDGMAAEAPTSGANAAQDPQYLTETRATYQQILDVAEEDQAPSVAYRRLAFLDLFSGDAAAALSRLEQAVAASPGDAESLYALGEVRYYLGMPGEAAQAWRAYLLTPEGREDEEAQARATNAERIAPLLEASEADRSVESLLALADALWEMEDRPRAAGYYAQILTELEVEHPRAVRRLGMALFFAGRTEEAVLALERARGLEPTQPETLLFLGNAYASLQQDAYAVEAWRAYVEAVGGEELAGRVPNLIAQAEARIAGAPAPPEAPVPAENVIRVGGAELFAANCASCHGPNGNGGAGPRLAGNSRAADASMVERTIRSGRGRMPGFGAILSDADIAELTRFVQELAQP